MKQDVAGAPVETTKHSKELLLALIVLLVLRFPLLPLGASGVLNQGTIYYCATYLLAGLLIYRHRNHLERYHITPVALLLFLAAPFLAILAGNMRDPTLWARAAMTASLAFILVKKAGYRFHWEKGIITKNRGLILVTILLCAVTPIAIHAIRGFPMSDYPVSMHLPGMWFCQLSSEAISDALLFRGFLWGFLKDKGIREPWICLIQTGLYSAGCLLYLDDLAGILIVNPLFSLLLGLLAWKSKSITSSTVVHASADTFTLYLLKLTFLRH